MAQVRRRDFRKRLIRLWLAATVFWLTFWIWLYSTKCFHAGNGALWCPSAGDPTSATLVRSSDWRMLAIATLPPLWAGITGLLAWWAFQGFQKKKGGPG